MARKRSYPSAEHIAAAKKKYDGKIQAIMTSNHDLPDYVADESDNECCRRMCEEMGVPYDGDCDD